ncbi:hypothetical protein B1R32_1435 [Abditibacterium utsteinense]|uniref:Tetratricopeptide repeat-containing protein n=1 Tax=Abditibacterium utsteinense TaxID=1960156 RepID=A0A2S8SNM5_9BACT|nr:hypothetical protein [Abditibacterium utsteinense]PQV62386.1 hypothetical protein B1R32_1435 [Abditibacterium utsteinense]
MRNKNLAAHVCFVMAIVLGALSQIQAQSKQNLASKYDLGWLPITKLQLQNAILKAGDSPILMYHLMRRAMVSDQSDTFYQVIKPLAQKELNAPEILHPVFIAAYADSLTRTSLASEEERSQIGNYLEKASKPRKDLWFVLYIRASMEKYQSDSGLRRSMKTLEKAITLAPEVSFLRSSLGWTYGSIKVNEHLKTGEWDRLNLEQNLIATKLQPVNTVAYIGLIGYYKWKKPNAAKAQIYRKKVLSLIPPGARLNPKMQKFFASYNIEVPQSQRLK